MNDRPAMDCWLSPDEGRRYLRHALLPQVGVEGQRRLKGAAVLVIGVGGLGCPAAQYLTAAGVGRIGLVDGDRIDLTNLQRQILFGQADLGRPKAQAAREHLQALNPHVRIEAYDEPFTAANGAGLVADYDLTLDATDNFRARYCINDACVLAGRPLLHAALHQFEGQLTLFGAPGGPCYRCLHPDAPPAGAAGGCAAAGVLGAVPGVLGAMQAGEALKWILGIGRPLAGRLVQVDLLTMQWRELTLARNPACPLCGEHPRIRTLRDEAHAQCAAQTDEAVTAINGDQLNVLLERGDPCLLFDLRDPDERAAGAIPGSRPIPLQAIVQAAAGLDPAQPVVVYCQFGQRSIDAARQLQRAGLRRVFHLEGGFLLWSRLARLAAARP